MKPVVIFECLAQPTFCVEDRLLLSFIVQDDFNEFRNIVPAKYPNLVIAVTIEPLKVIFH